MNEAQILKELKEQRRGDQVFIKWWRKEEDWLDIELIDRFVDESGTNREIGGYELMTTAQMWDELKKVCGDRVARGEKDGQQLVLWTRKGDQRSCPFTPESLLEIFDTETRGNYVDS